MNHGAHGESGEILDREQAVEAVEGAAGGEGGAEVEVGPGAGVGLELWIRKRAWKSSHDHDSGGEKQINMLA